MAINYPSTYAKCPMNSVGSV